MSTELTDEQIIELYSQGLSLKKIAAILGRSIRRPERVIKKAGIMRAWQGSGPQHSQWTGGRLPAGEGYWRVWVDPSDPMHVMSNHQGYVREHRLVMARHLGRPLHPEETVHHINGDKSDNRIENLEIHWGKHGKGLVLCCAECGSKNLIETGISK